MALIPENSNAREAIRKRIPLQFTPSFTIRIMPDTINNMEAIK
jgi:hypothetical protein